MRTRKRPPRGIYASEGELCDAFAEAALPAWAVYPETSGWDLVLVDRATGEQVGVEAKLRANLEVLVQAHSRDPGRKGPAVRSVLVPDCSAAFRYVARELRLMVVEAWKLDALDATLASAPRWSPKDPLWLPPFEPDPTGGGRPGPTRLTPWKCKALELCALLRERGYVERKDLSRLKLSPHWWLDARFGPVLVACPSGSRGRYVPAPGASLPDERWPELAAAMRVGKCPTDLRGTVQKV